MKAAFKIYLLVTFLTASCQKNEDESRPYEFGFTIDGQQHRHEKKDVNGIIQGEFGFITADGIYHVTVYATDENGNFKILSMRNVRISAPLDGSPLPPGAKIESYPGAGKQIQTQPQPQTPVQQQPQPQLQTRIQQQPQAQLQPQPQPQIPVQPQVQTQSQPIQTTSRPRTTYAFTTQPTIKPACGGCGYVTTPKPRPGELFPFQIQPFQKPSQQNNGISAAQTPQSSPIQPSTNYPTQPVTNYPVQPGASLPAQPESNNPAQPGASLPTQSESNYPAQPGASLPAQPGTNYPVQPGASFSVQPESNYPAQPRASFPAQPGTNYPPQPEVNYPAQPGSNNPTQPGINYPAQPGLNYPVQPGQNYPTPQNANLESRAPFPPSEATGLINPVPGSFPGSIQGGISSGPVSGSPNEIDLNRPRKPLSQVSVSDGIIHVPGNPDIPIKDKFPGMVDGLPEGVTQKDVTDLLYKFNYTVGFHGHYEKGLKNGSKIGGYFVTGRDGLQRIVTYVADENGFRPKVRFVRLDLNSDEVPKEGTEKTFGLKNFEFVWYPVS